MVNRRVPSPEQKERLWTCPAEGCPYKVWSVARPKPCEDHPFKAMKEAFQAG